MQEGDTVEENTRMFALLNLALADAAIVSWECIYAYNYWRPITAIQEADTYGNAATAPDPTWTPLLETPLFPEYVSGHGSFSAAAATVLARF
jgi:membrane-associated phospholipid phosphatase